MYFLTNGHLNQFSLGQIAIGLKVGSEREGQGLSFVPYRPRLSF